MLGNMKSTLCKSIVCHIKKHCKIELSVLGIIVWGDNYKVLSHRLEILFCSQRERRSDRDTNNKEFFPGWEVVFGDLVSCVVF